MMEKLSVVVSSDGNIVALASLGVRKRTREAVYAETASSETQS
jgi:hypothetical protein